MRFVKSLAQDLRHEGNLSTAPCPKTSQWPWKTVGNTLLPLCSSPSMPWRGKSSPPGTVLLWSALRQPKEASAFPTREVPSHSPSVLLAEEDGGPCWHTPHQKAQQQQPGRCWLRLPQSYPFFVGNYYKLFHEWGFCSFKIKNHCRYSTIIL